MVLVIITALSGMNGERMQLCHRTLHNSTLSDEDGVEQLSVMSLTPCLLCSWQESLIDIFRVEEDSEGPYLRWLLHLPH